MNVTFLNKRPLLLRRGRLLKQGCLFKKITPTRGRLIDRGACLAEGAYSVIYGKRYYKLNVATHAKVRFLCLDFLLLHDFSGISVGEFGGNKYFTGHHKPDTIHSLRNSFWSLKCTTVTVGYAKISSNFPISSDYNNWVD